MNTREYVTSQNHSGEPFCRESSCYYSEVRMGIWDLSDRPMGRYWLSGLGPPEAGAFAVYQASSESSSATSRWAKSVAQ
jgi:hypothetical protein